MQWQVNGARLYDPVLGRFLGVEPLADLYSSIGVYAYSICDPVNLRDPSGLYAENGDDDDDCSCGCPNTPPCSKGKGIVLQTVDIVTDRPEVGNDQPSAPTFVFIPLFGGFILNGADLATGAHLGLAALGSTEIPVVSQLADLADGVLSLAEGDTEGALMSAGGILIPGFSQAKLLRTGARVAARVAEATSQATKMAKARAAGRAGELAAGITGKKKVIEVNGRTRVPDQVIEKTGDTKEVKNVQRQSLTSQIRDYADYSQQKGGKFTLVVGEHTQISKPLQDFAANGNVIINRIPMPK